MKPSQNARPSVVVRDGYVGLNINPKRGKAGRQAGLDHFGFEVEDVNIVYDRLKKDYPSIKVLKRPRNGARGLMMSVYFRDPDMNLIEVSNYAHD